MLPANAMKTLPSAVTTYRRTAEFTEVSVPKALLHAHTTKAGVWGRIRVLQGRLLYRILEPELRELVLTAEIDGVVEPQVPHEVEPLGAVRFYVEFLRED